MLKSFKTGKAKTIVNSKMWSLVARVEPITYVEASDLLFLSASHTDYHNDVMSIFFCLKTFTSQMPKISTGIKEKTSSMTTSYDSLHELEKLVKYIKRKQRKK